MIFSLLLAAIAARPFVSSLAYPRADLLLSAAILMLLLAHFILRQGDLARFSLAQAAAAALLSCLILSTAFSRDIAAGAGQAQVYITGLLLCAFSSSLDREKRRMLLLILLASCLLVSLAGLYQYFFGLRRTLDYLHQHRVSSGFAFDFLEARRAFFPFVTPNMLGGYLAMMLPLFLIKRKYLVCALPACAALVLTKSIGALASLLAVAAAVALFRRRRLGIKFKLTILALCLGTVIVLCVRAAMPRPHQQPLFSTVMRFSYWKDTLAIIARSPLIGVGPGNFNLPQTRYAHNFLLQFCAETGVSGLGALLWLIAAILKSGYARLRAAKQPQETLCLLSAVSVFLIHNLVDFTFFLPETSLIWWLLLGLLL